MMTKQGLASAVVHLLAGAAAAASAGPLLADKQSVDQACAAEAATAQCGGEQAGHGMLKCIGSYRKANPAFRVSPACSAAIKQLRGDRRAMKNQQAPAAP